MENAKDDYRVDYGYSSTYLKDFFFCCRTAEQRLLIFKVTSKLWELGCLYNSRFVAKFVAKVSQKICQRNTWLLRERQSSKVTDKLFTACVPGLSGEW